MQALQVKRFATLTARRSVSSKRSGSSAQSWRYAGKKLKSSSRSAYTPTCSVDFASFYPSLHLVSRRQKRFGRQYLLFFSFQEGSAESASPRQMQHRASEYSARLASSVSPLSFFTLTKSSFASSIRAVVFFPVAGGEAVIQNKQSHLQKEREARIVFPGGFAATGHDLVEGLG